MNKRLILLIIVLIGSFPLYITAQQTLPIVSPLRLYADGKQLFLEKNYAAAQHSLQAFMDERTTAELQQEAAYMLACAAYELKDKNRLEVLRNYLEEYPDSPYSNRVNALMASDCFLEGKYDEAIAMYNSCELYRLGDKERDDNTFRLATAYLKVNQLRQAGVWFETLKSSSPRYDKDATYHLAYINYANGKYEKSQPDFLSLQEDEKYGELVPYYIADTYLKRELYDKSQIVAEGYLSSYPHHKGVAQMQRVLGESQYYMKNYTEAVKSLVAYTSAVTKPERKSLYLLGMSYYHTGVYSKAAEMFGEVTSTADALSQNAYLHLGLSYLALKDKNKARLAFEQAASGTFDEKVKEQALYNYALCIHETSYSPFDESVTVFERFLNEFPASVYSSKVSDYLVEVYMNTKSYKAALKSIEKIAHPGTRILEAKQKILFRLGTEAFANAQFEEAIQYFDRSLSFSSYSMQTKADAYYWRGESYYRQNRFADADRDFRQYLEFTQLKSNDMYELSLYNLGYVNFKEKKYANALTWFSRYTDQTKGANKTMLADAYNRIGDCSFYARNFTTARQNYAKAVQIDPALGDYSLYQEAFVLGLQKDYRGKISLLNRLIEQYPTSEYLDDALYERGRAYVLQGDNNNAIESFRELVDKFAESNAARKGANEIGLLYYQADNYDAAIKAYKHVIVAYPGSEEARLAQRDLKSIYIDLNKVDEYANFVSDIPGGASFDIGERDSLTYIAAEKVYLRGEMKEAKMSLTRYLQTFPQGAFKLSAHYYIGLIDYNQKNFKEALAHFSQVLEFPNNKFSEDAMVISAELLFNSKEYDKALALYKQLSIRTAVPERRLQAKIGVLRTANLMNEQIEVIHAATDLLADGKLSPELANEARYDRAKAYLEQKATKAAMEDLQVLSKDTRNVYGAEAKYKVAELFFTSGETTKAEKEILDYIDKSTPHAYWLARSFILLSDVYVKLGKKLDAKQYLLSLQQNYRANDDIQGMIGSRLNKLNK
ncbi:MAG: tetratricopeptide repeat protein [Bacteroidaceae bacterium]